MTKKKLYSAPHLKVHQIKTESVILAGSDIPSGQNETYGNGSTSNWFENTEG